MDRPTYTKLVTAPYRDEETMPNLIVEKEESHQEIAAAFFRQSFISSFKEKSISQSQADRVKYILTWANNSVDRMSPVMIEVQMLLALPVCVSEPAKSTG